MTPLFSIITICRNASSQIGVTLASVDSQTCTDYEHLVIDGASTDTTLDVVESHASPARKVLSEPDRGLYDAMNKGLQMANGKYVLFLNAGDSFASQEVLAGYAVAARKGASVIYSDTELVDVQGTVIGKRHLSAPPRLTFRSFAQGMLVCHQAFCVRRDLAPVYDLQYRYSADYEWCLHILRQTVPEECVNLHTVGIRYLSEGVTTRHHKESLKERYDIMCRYYGKLPTMLRHVGFAMRHLMRKIKGKGR